MILFAQSDARHIPLADQSIQCVITSPPYLGLRDYGLLPSVWGGEPGCEHEWGDDLQIDRRGTQIGKAITVDARESKRGAFCLRCGAWRGCLGLEPTPQLYVGHLVEVFREVKRVLRDDGCLWINLGDSYASGKGTCYNPGGGESSLGQDRKAAGAHPLDRGNKSTLESQGLKPKDLMMIPARVALALQAEGWYLRSMAPWLKRSAMPESVTDRPSSALEYVFLLSKSPNYYYDADAVRKTIAPSSVSRLEQDIAQQEGSHRGNGGTKANGTMKAVGNPAGRNRRNTDWFYESLGFITDDAGGPLAFDVNPQAYKAAHYATFPEKLVEPMVLASTSAKGACPACGAPWVRVVERTTRSESYEYKTIGIPGEGEQRGRRPGAMGYGLHTATLGWRPSCSCGCSDPDIRPDDLGIVASPTGGDGESNDPTMETGRRGMNRPRGDDEGQRPITRYEQRHYAVQLRNSPHRDEMERQAGAAFAHYIRTDRSGARPIPPDLLAHWLASGWLYVVNVPEWEPLPPVPCICLDPFAGSGTVGRVAVRHGRRAVLLDLNAHYLADFATVRTDNVQLEMGV
jgi:DNA modification methylase